MASLEGSSHDANVTSAVECVVAATVGHVDESLLDGLALLQVLGWVDKVGTSKLGRPVLLRVVDVHHNDLACATAGCTLNNGETDASSTEDCNVGSLLNTTLASGDDGRTVTSGDTAAQQASPVHWCLVGDGNDGDIGDDGVLGEGGATHEVEKLLTLALESRSSIRHDTLALGGPNLAAEVGLARLAEFALFAFWRAVKRNSQLQVLNGIV